jgi:RNA polymerase sigma factor for flagellar operon FliA
MGWLPRSEYARVRFEERASRYLEQLNEQQAAERHTAFDSGKAEEEAAADPHEQNLQALAHGINGVAAVFITLLGTMGEEALLDDRPAAHEQLERHQLGQRIRRVLATLPDKERHLIELYYFGDQTLEQVGVSLGLSKSWASRLHARAVALLREGLSTDGNS